MAVKWTKCEVKKDSFSPKICTSPDRGWNRGSRNMSTSKNHKQLWSGKDAIKNATLPPKCEVSQTKERGDGESWKKRIPIFNISKREFPPLFSPRSILRKVWTAFDYIEKNQLEANTQCGKPFLIPPKVCRVIRNGKQSILMKSIGLD